MRRKKAEVSKRQYSSKANSSNVHDFAVAKNTVHGRVDTWVTTNTKINILNVVLEVLKRTVHTPWEQAYAAIPVYFLKCSKKQRLY